MSPDSLPLFPLDTVLFPDGLLPLRIFEPRYLDLIRDCGRQGSSFGICLILSGSDVTTPAMPMDGRVSREAGSRERPMPMDGRVSREAGGRERPTPAAVGCEARMVDFSSTDDGLLGITVQGGRRFRVVQTRVRDNGLIVADVEWQVESDVARIRPEHQLLATLLERILDRAEADFERSQLQDAAWVGWRLAEWLPLQMTARQMLLQEPDPHRRLQILVEQLPEFQPD